MRAHRQAKALISTSRAWRPWQKSIIPWSQSPKHFSHWSRVRTTPLQKVNRVSSTFVRYASLRTKSSRLAERKRNFCKKYKKLLKLKDVQILKFSYSYYTVLLMYALVNYTYCIRIINWILNIHQTSSIITQSSFLVWKFFLPS